MPDLKSDAAARISRSTGVNAASEAIGEIPSTGPIP
jgi:hypothetical protein